MSFLRVLVWVWVIIHPHIHRRPRDTIIIRSSKTRWIEACERAGLIDSPFYPLFYPPFFQLVRRPVNEIALVSHVRESEGGGQERNVFCESNRTMLSDCSQTD